MTAKIMRHITNSVCRTKLTFVLNLFLIAVLCVSCSTGKKVADSVGEAAQVAKKEPSKLANQVANILHYIDPWAQPSADAPAQFKKAADELQARHFQEALDGFDGYLNRETVTQWTQAATLNAGRALEGLERWTEAEARFRKVVVSTDNAPELQARALYRLSFVEDALGNEQQTVAILNDLLIRAKYLPPEIARAELPARLAAAYARVGNFDKAIEFYNKAEAGIAQLRSSAPNKAVPDWLPSTLYFMGTMGNQHVSWDQFESALRPLARGQVYMLQAAELGIFPWSDYAAADLIKSYNNIWLAIERPKITGDGDPLLQRRALQDRQWDRVALVVESLYGLRARLLPTPNAGSLQAKRIRDYADDLEKKAQAVLLERPAGEGLTIESLIRKTEVRGTVIDPDDTLERKFIKSAAIKSEGKAAEKPTESRVTQPVPAPAQPSVPVHREDPNL